MQRVVLRPSRMQRRSPPLSSPASTESEARKGTKVMLIDTLSHCEISALKCSFGQEPPPAVILLERPAKGVEKRRTRGCEAHGTATACDLSTKSNRITHTAKCAPRVSCSLPSRNPCKSRVPGRAPSRPLASLTRSGAKNSFLALAQKPCNGEDSQGSSPTPHVTSRAPRFTTNARET